MMIREGMNEWTNEWNGANEWQPEKDPKRGENVTGGREGRTRGDEEAKREKSKRGGEPAGRRVAVSCSETKRAKRVYWCSCASDKSVWSVCPAVCLSICLSVRNDFPTLFTGYARPLVSRFLYFDILQCYLWEYFTLGRNTTGDGQSSQYGRPAPDTS